MSSLPLVVFAVARRGRVGKKNVVRQEQHTGLRAGCIILSIRFGPQGTDDFDKRWGSSPIRWNGHAAKRPDDELIEDILLPMPLRTWRRRTGGQHKMWATTIKADLEPLSGPRVVGCACWRKYWAKVASELAKNSRAWSASVRDVVKAIGDAGSTRPG